MDSCITGFRSIATFSVSANRGQITDPLTTTIGRVPARFSGPNLPDGGAKSTDALVNDAMSSLEDSTKKQVNAVLIETANAVGSVFDQFGPRACRKG